MPSTSKRRPEPFLLDVTLVEERRGALDCYPFSIPAVRHLGRLEFGPTLTVFAGENGSGKSTLIEAIAVAAGLNLEGGSRHYHFSTHPHVSELATAIRLGHGIRRLNQSDAFFYRAESFDNVATEAKQLGVAGCSSWHEQSHGESFLSLLTDRFGGNGLYLLDEPEAALSPLRQLAMLRVIHELAAEGSQFIVATHSPILMGYPGATLYWLSSEGHHRMAYEETEHFQVMRAFLHNREAVFRELFADAVAPDGESPIASENC